ncbi:hypothetical protein CS542_02410 [Pedobacter sp. IW39]|nr:hypothetical protein CS542_02410 [Pedobacter sp. IW39]
MRSQVNPLKCSNLGVGYLCFYAEDQYDFRSDLFAEVLQFGWGASWGNNGYVPPDWQVSADCNVLDIP